MYKVLLKKKKSGGVSKGGWNGRGVKKPKGDEMGYKIENFK